ncbi:MAG: hypothetical protein ACI8XX_000639, partial [Polaribacter sp.]
ARRYTQVKKYLVARPFKVSLRSFSKGLGPV